MSVEVSWSFGGLALSTFGLLTCFFSFSQNIIERGKKEIDGLESLCGLLEGGAQVKG